MFTYIFLVGLFSNEEKSNSLGFMRLLPVRSSAVVDAMFLELVLIIVLSLCYELGLVYGMDLLGLVKVAPLLVAAGLLSGATMTAIFFSRCRGLKISLLRSERSPVLELEQGAIFLGEEIEDGGTFP